MAGLKTEWTKTQDGRSTVRAYKVVTEDGAISDVELGFAYIYGDVVHADPKRIAQTEEHGVVERYKAAVPLVAQLMINTIATLNVIKLFVERGHLDLPGEPFERTVTVTATEFVTPIQNFVHTSAVNPNPHDLNAVVGTLFTYEDAIEMLGWQADGPEDAATG
ncbi:hypothetical protein [Rhodococcus triatomae]|nr:hypothetical protein G419_16615 [Rhodococcus triatomae BKS 15-14]